MTQPQNGGMPKRENWGTRIGVILAVTGSAVGLGNFLRFPGLAAEYGGGAFMIPYIVAFLLLGLPIAWAEWAIGRYGGGAGLSSAPGIFLSVWKNRAAPYFGVLGPLIPAMIYMYYVFVEAWCLGYAWYYLTGQMNFADQGAAGAFFERFVGMQENGLSFTTRDGASALMFLGICFALNFFLIYRGINKGIEWFCKFAMPALVLCAFIVLIRVLTLGGPDADGAQKYGVLDGLGAMWNPTRPGQTLLGALSNPEIWVAAAGQIFFSLSIGFGIVITYASYMRRDDDVALSGVTAASGNGFCEVALGGLITIPAAMMFLGPAFVADPPGTFGMGFVALPYVFNEMPAGQFIGFLFFFLLFLAAVTSSLSMLQPCIALLEEGLGIGRKASVTLLSMITAMGCLFIVFFSKGLLAMDTIDFWVGTVGIYIMATIQVILFGWVLGIDKGMAELDRGAEIRLPRFIKYIIKYVAPIYLLGIFVLWAINNLPDRVRQIVDVQTNGPVVLLSLGLIGLVLVFFLLLIGRAVVRWRQLGLPREEGVAPPDEGFEVVPMAKSAGAERPEVHS